MRYLIVATAAALAGGAALAEDAEERGFALYQQNCRTCHVVTEGDHRLGPSLHAIIGREVGSHADFDYSGSLAQADAVWDEDLLDAFLRDPEAVFPGNQMLFPGMPDAEDRRALIAYLASPDGDDAENDAAD